MGMRIIDFGGRCDCSADPPPLPRKAPFPTFSPGATATCHATLPFLTVPSDCFSFPPLFPFLSCHFELAFSHSSNLLWALPRSLAGNHEIFVSADHLFHEGLKSLFFAHSLGVVVDIKISYNLFSASCSTSEFLSSLPRTMSARPSSELSSQAFHSLLLSSLILYSPIPAQM